MMSTVLSASARFVEVPERLRRITVKLTSGTYVLPIQNVYGDLVGNLGKSPSSGVSKMRQ